jgi:hypothetical protein
MNVETSFFNQLDSYSRRINCSAKQSLRYKIGLAKIYLQLVFINESELVPKEFIPVIALICTL